MELFIQPDWRLRAATPDDNIQVHVCLALEIVVSTLRPNLTMKAPLPKLAAPLLGTQTWRTRNPFQSMYDLVGHCEVPFLYAATELLCALRKPSPPNDRGNVAVFLAGSPQPSTGILRIAQRHFHRL